MRTTLTLDDDVANYLKEQSLLLNKLFKQVVNDTLRQGMLPPAYRSERPWKVPLDDNQAEPRRPFKIVPHHSGFQPGIDPTKLNQLLDDMDIEEFRRKNPWW